MTKNDLHWLAGLLEGEGSFMAYRNTVKGKVYYYPRIVLGMTDEDIVRRVAVLFDSALNNPPYKQQSHHKRRWVTVLTNSRARDLMLLLRPIMGIRRQQQIDKALRCEIKLPRRLTQQLADEMRAKKHAGATNIELMEAYNISYQTVFNVIKNISW